MKMEEKMKPWSFTAAVIQHPPVYLNLDESLKKACFLIEEAVDQGANMIAFPETWLPGYPVWLDFFTQCSIMGLSPCKSTLPVVSRKFCHHTREAP